MESYAACCSVVNSAVVLMHTARIVKPISLKDFFWFDIVFEDVQYLLVRATVLPECTAIQVQVVVY